MTGQTPPGDRPLWIAPLVVYLFSSLVVFSGGWLGISLLRGCRDFQPLQTSRASVSHLTAWDGGWFRMIVEDGYAFSQTERSSIAFFPVYPLCGRLVKDGFALSTDWALILVSNAALLGALMGLAGYMASRSTLDQIDTQRGESSWILLMLAFAPSTFFFRMAYSDSLFLCIVVLAFLMMARGHHPLFVALLVGLATATRSVGIALVPPLMFYIHRSSNTRRVFAVRSALCLPLSVWGLTAFMAYQWYEFNDPLAFVHAQEHWRVRRGTVGEQVIALATLEPVWAVYMPDSLGYWQKFAPHSNALFNLFFANPFYYGGAWLAIGIGWRKRWLNTEEVLLGVGLLAIPYIMQAYAHFMAAEARYASVVFPQYIVAARMLVALPDFARASVLAVMAFFLGCYSALFCAWYWFY